MTSYSDPTLAKAEADLRKAEELIERATKDRDEIAAFIRRHKMYSSPASSYRGTQKAVRDETMAEALEAVLSEANAPLLVPDIIAALKTRGRKFTSANPAAHVSSILSRSEQFHYEKGIGWTFRTP